MRCMVRLPYTIVGRDRNQANRLKPVNREPAHASSRVELSRTRLFTRCFRLLLLCVVSCGLGSTCLFMSVLVSHACRGA